MYKKTDDISSPVIDQLLLERRMPLSEEKEQEVLFSLSRALVEEGRFLLLCTVKEEHAHDSEVSAEEITISPLLMAEDEKYLPVFTKEAFMQEMGMIKEKDQESQAHRLFDELREIDNDESIKKVFARCPSIQGIGLAVYNRLIRAAGFEVIDLEKI